MTDDELIRRGDVASVVRQTLVDAAHRNAGKSGNWPSAFFKAEDYASVAIAALPAVTAPQGVDAIKIADEVFDHFEAKGATAEAFGAAEVGERLRAALAAIREGHEQR